MSTNTNDEKRSVALANSEGAPKRDRIIVFWRHLAFWLRFVSAHRWWFLAAASVTLWGLSFSDWPQTDSKTWRRLIWSAGWAALFGLCIPFLHMLRVSVWGHRQKWWLGGQTFWLRCHFIAAFAAFFFTLLHSGGHANGVLTLIIMLLFWLVMLSGIIGFWGRRLIYRFLNVVIRPEFGRARLRTKERDRLQRRAHRLVAEPWKLTELDLDQANWKDFCQAMLNKGVWQRVKKSEKKAVDEAARIVDRAIAGEILNAGDMNPVIGVLNSFLEKRESVTLAELEQFVIDQEPPSGEKSSVEQQRCQALLAKALDELKRTQNEDEKHQIRGRVFLEMLFTGLRECQPASPLLKELYGKHVQKLLDNSFEQRMELRDKQRKAGSPPGADNQKLLDNGTPLWGWIFTPGARDPIPKAIIEDYRRALDKNQQELLDQLLKWVRRRRQLNLEEWFDRVANCWLWVHGFLAAVLGALVLDHVIGSVYFAW